MEETCPMKFLKKGLDIYSDNRGHMTDSLLRGKKGGATKSTKINRRLGRQLIKEREGKKGLGKGGEGPVFHRGGNSSLLKEEC